MKVRTVSENDYQGIAKLELDVWGQEAATLHVIKSRHQVFPEGSLIVEDDEGKIVGYVALQKVNLATSESWFKQTDNGYIQASHRANGHILYGIGMSGSKYGVGELIINYAFKHFITSGICYMVVLGTRLPGFAKWHRKNKMDIKEYLNRRRHDGYSIDPELKMYQKHGFEVLHELREYFPCKESLNYGALIVKK